MSPAIAHIDKTGGGQWLACLKRDSRTRPLSRQITEIDVTIAGLDVAELIELVLLLVAVVAGQKRAVSTSRTRHS